jgi:hypothetical protein
MQAYLPGAGWIDFDPTNNIIGNRNLIRVAVAWAPNRFCRCGVPEGDAGSFSGMDVTVTVSEVLPDDRLMRTYHQRYLKHEGEVAATNQGDSDRPEHDSACLMKNWGYRV